MKKVKPKKKAAQKVSEPRRIPVSLRMTAETKSKIDANAQKNVRSQSAEIENLIERCLTYDQMLNAMHDSLENIVKGNFVAAVRAQPDYVAVHSPHGIILYPAKHPDVAHIQKSGFIDPEDKS